MSISSFVSRVFGFVKHAAVAVGAAFVKIVGHDNAVAFGHDALHVLQSDLGKIVTTVVDAVQTQDPSAPGDVKFSSAVAQVKTTAAAAGIEAKDSIIHLLIQLAVSVLKGHFGPA